MTDSKEETKKKEVLTVMLVLLGFAGVGKTAIATQYCNNFFPAKYEPTISDRYKKTVSLNKKRVDVHILDTAGQPAYSTLPEEHLQEGDGFMIIYGVDTQESFEKAQELFDDLVEVRDEGDKCPVVLVANRTDIGRRVVTEAQGRDRLAAWQEAHPMDNKSKVVPLDYIECTAKGNEHIAICFDILTEALLSRAQDMGNDEEEDWRATVPQVSWCAECGVM